MLQERLSAKRLIRTLLRQLSSIPLFSAIHTSTCWQPPSSANSSLCSATLPFPHRIQARSRQTSRDTPSFGPLLSTPNSHHFPFVHKVRRYFTLHSRHPFSRRCHLAFSRKATLLNLCICAFAKSTYALRVSFDARSAPDRLSRSINPRQRRRQHADKALASTIPCLPVRQKAR